MSVFKTRVFLNPSLSHPDKYTVIFFYVVVEGHVSDCNRGKIREYLGFGDKTSHKSHALYIIWFDDWFTNFIKKIEIFFLFISYDEWNELGKEEFNFLK